MVACRGEPGHRKTWVSVRVDPFGVVQAVSTTPSPYATKDPAWSACVETVLHGTSLGPTVEGPMTLRIFVYASVAQNPSVDDPVQGRLRAWLEAP